jgi:hypothetical protein
MAGNLRPHSLPRQTAAKVFSDSEKRGLLEMREEIFSSWEVGFSYVELIPPVYFYSLVIAEKN